VLAIDDPVAHACLNAERDCVLALDATCDTPVGVLAEPIGSELRRLKVSAYAGAPDGSLWIRDSVEGGLDSGRVIAERMLSAGAGEILAAER
jgi:hydroxymethylbilane synthase